MSNIRTSKDRKRAKGGFLAVTLALVAAACSGTNAGEENKGASSHPEVSFAGSNFEIDTDANIKADDPAPSKDWGNVPQCSASVTTNCENRKADLASGGGDDSFGQGTKEDTAVPTVVDGSIPPNKSDLKFFGVFQEGDTATGFLNLYWSRVQDPSGTTNMDFEFNARQCTPGLTPADPDCTSNGVTPIRSIGDLLIIYDLANGGTNPVLSLREWTGTEWGAATNLTTSGTATGSINTTPIPASDADGLGAHSARTFGEAQIKLSAIFNDPTKCEGFGSAYLKSRSSDAFNAATKDFIAPTAVNISNCGRVVVQKTDGTSALAGAEFTINPANSATPPSDDLVPVSGATGLFCIDKLLIGTEYTVHESVTPPGYDPAADQKFTPSTTGSCSGVTSSTTPDLTFVNLPQKGAIVITKTQKSVNGPIAHAGVSFTVNGVTKTTDANGKACFDNLPFTSYTVRETVPVKYLGEGDVAAGGNVDKSVSVTKKADCTTTGIGDAATVSFVNTPLSDITVSFSSQITNGTAAKIACTGLTATPPDGTPNAFNDTSETFVNLKPGTYNCTVEIDP